MNKSLNIEQRKLVWITLSNFYLDTGFEDSDYKQMANILLKTSYSFKEIKSINKYEVYPILKMNLSSTVGVWSGFDEKWLIEKISQRIESSSNLSSIGLEISYFINSWMYSIYFKKLKKAYESLKHSQ